MQMLEKVKELIAEILPDTKIEDLTEDTRFQEDLCFDSLNMMMLSVKLEDIFGFRFTSCVQFETLSDVCGYLTSRI